MTENGEHEISYYDVFGKLRTGTIDLADTFIYNGTDYGIHIELSPEEDTTEHVLVSAKAHGDGKVIFKEHYDDGEMAMTPVEGSATEPTAEKTVKVTENQWVKVYRTNSSGYIGRDSVSIKVYVDNIIDGAPIANVKYYVESLGREFGYAELSDYIEKYHGGTFETNGRVTAYYKTSRHVTPLNDETHIYTSEEKIYTFRYVDDFENEGSADAPLPEGLVLTEPKLPPVDREAPIVYVDIYAKRFEKYSKEDAFNASSSAALMKESFDAVGTVQGYSLKLTVKDESPYEIKATGSDNAVLSGNSINISLPEDFTVTVTDEAGNSITVPRFIRILGSGTLYLKVNGEAVLPDSTKEIKTGKVTLSVSGLKDGEPYTVKIRRGLKSKGQMKYLKESAVKFENGECTIESPGYYTVLVTTQSRQTVLLRLYAEN